MRRMLAAFGVLSVVVGTAFAQEPPVDEPPYDWADYRYSCAGGTTIAVAYINLDSGLSLAVVQVDRRMLVMQNVPSASGARYATVPRVPEEKTRAIWWTDGADGFFQEGPIGEEEMVHTACVG